VFVLIDCFSEWLPLKGSIPQGTWLGPLIFVLLINDLSTGCMLHKFVDDSTLTEIFERGEPSAMRDHFNNVTEWSRDNLMNVNYEKTKEMLLDTVNDNEISQLIVDGNTIARVYTFKLLGMKAELCTSHDCRVSNRVPSHTCRVSSRVSIHCFFQGPSPESSPESSVSNPSLRELLSKFLESCLKSL